MKRVPVPVDDHRRAKAKAAEMGLTLERYVSIIINHADHEPAESIMGWIRYNGVREGAGPVAE